MVMAQLQGDLVHSRRRKEVQRGELLLETCKQFNDFNDNKLGYIYSLVAVLRSTNVN